MVGKKRSPVIIKENNNINININMKEEESSSETQSTKRVKLEQSDDSSHIQLSNDKHYQINNDNNNDNENDIINDDSSEEKQPVYYHQVKKDEERRKFLKLKEKDMKRIYRKYSELFMYLKHTDESDYSSEFQKLKAMDSFELQRKIVDIENKALRLRFEEALELRRGQELDVFKN